MSGGHHPSYAAHVAAALASRDWEPEFFVPAPLAGVLERLVPERSAVIIPFADRREPVRSLVRPRALLRAFDAVRSRGIEHVVLLYLDRWILPLRRVLARSADLRMVGCLHQLYMLDAASRSRLLGLQRGIERRALRDLTDAGLRLTVHTSLQARQLAAYLDRSAPAVMPYPIELPPPSPAGFDVRARHGIPADARLALCFGATRREKGADVAARILERLPEEWHLLIAGRAADFDRSRLHALAGGARGRLHCALGHVDDLHVEACFRAADVVLLPYRMEFAGQSGPLTIAAALHVPVVSSGNRQLSEIVRRYGLGASFAGLDADDGARTMRGLLDALPGSRRDAFLRDHAPEEIARVLDAELRAP